MLEMPDLMTPAGWLPLALFILLGLSMLAYAILDGYDLGVGILLRRAPDAHKDVMVASIGPFWDANETWLVLGVGLLMTAFPMAHGVILTALYLPVALMLLGLCLRGVAFKFRSKAAPEHKAAWNQAFWAGSLIATLAQGFMLGSIVLGFAPGWAAFVFACLIAVCLVAGYCLLGAGWLIFKTSGELQQQALRWAKASLWWTALGMAAVFLATPLASERIFDKWFSLPWVVLLAPIPLMMALLFVLAARSLHRLPTRLLQGDEYGTSVPFACAIGIFLLAFYGLAYSLFPYLVIDQMTLWQAAASPDSLWLIFIGACVMLPIIVGSSLLVYRVFGGKAHEMDYT